MTKRERRVFGSMRRLSSGRWQVRYRDLSGVLHTGPHTFISKADAARYLAMVEADLHRGTWTDPKLGRIILAEWAKRWQATTTNLRPTTSDLYAYLLRRFLLPTFGKAALSSIDPLAVRAWLTTLQVQQLSPSTIAKAYRLLSRILGAAVEAGYLLRNPCTSRGQARSERPRCGSPLWPKLPPWPTPSTHAIERWSWWPPTAGCAGASWSGCASSASTCSMAG
jgi:hypothetical protein